MAVLFVAISGLALGVLLSLGILDSHGRAALLSGLSDSILGLDHFIAHLGVGLWGDQIGAPRSSVLPVAFLLGAVPGFLLAAGQPPLPALDELVRLLAIASLVIVAAAVVALTRLPLREAISTVLLFGTCHGYVHGLEVGLAQILWFGLGSMLTSAAVLLLGLVVGLAAPRMG